MKQLLRLFAIIAVTHLASNVAFSQPVQGRCSVKGCPDWACPPGECLMGPNASGAEANAMGLEGLHPRWTKAKKFLFNDTYRQSLETRMTPQDRETIETTVADIKSHIASMKEHRPALEAALAGHDTASVHRMFHDARPVFHQLRTDRKTILDILAKYKNAKSAGSEEPISVYPNPVHLGGVPASVVYRTQQDGPVRITVTDGTGKTVQEIVNSNESAGEHTLQLGQYTVKPGAYYISIEADGKKSTQKVAAVE